MSENLMLRETYDKICEESKKLNERLSKDIPQELGQAYDTGGQWHDNPHWEYMVVDQQRLKKKQYEINEILDGVVFIENLVIDFETVSIGTKVEAKNFETGKIEIFRIVSRIDIVYNPGSSEKRFVSSESPRGVALLGRSVGEEVAINTPDGIKKLLILKIGPLF